jgi:hypothetical protein
MKPRKADVHRQTAWQKQSRGKEEHAKFDLMNTSFSATLQIKHLLTYASDLHKRVQEFWDEQIQLFSD